jgi:NADH:ubiquinone oxidoreductase subunit F (NADH-binding)
VVEVALGTPLRDIVAAASGDPAPQAVLLGGYGGTWLSGEYLDTPYCNEALRPLGVGVGAGVLVVLPRHACGIHETWRIAKYMANESARQCGPCAFGLPAIADDLGHLATVGRDLSQVLGRLEQRCGVVVGRGACAHPDGVVRMVRSALHVFRDDVDRHIRGAACAGSRAATKFAPVPSLEREEDLVWE